MTSSLNLEYEGIGIKKIKTEEQMIKLLKSLEKDFSKIQQFKIISPRGKVVKTFRCFIGSILNSDRGYIREPFDGGVFFTLEGTGSICGFQIRDRRVKYSLLEAYYLLIQYRLDTERREKNCIHLCETNDPNFYLNLYPNLYCTFSAVKHFVGYINADSMTDCPKYEYDQELRIKGRNGSDPKTLNGLLRELFAFSLELPKWRTYSPLFHIYSKAAS